MNLKYRIWGLLLIVTISIIFNNYCYSNDIISGYIILGVSLSLPLAYIIYLLSYIRNKTLKIILNIQIVYFICFIVAMTLLELKNDVGRLAALLLPIVYLLVIVIKTIIVFKTDRYSVKKYFYGLLILLIFVVLTELFLFEVIALSGMLTRY